MSAADELARRSRDVIERVGPKLEQSDVLELQRLESSARWAQFADRLCELLVERRPWITAAQRSTIEKLMDLVSVPDGEVGLEHLRDMAQTRQLLRELGHVPEALQERARLLRATSQRMLDMVSDRAPDRAESLRSAQAAGEWQVVVGLLFASLVERRIPVSSEERDELARIARLFAASDQESWLTHLRDPEQTIAQLTVQPPAP